MYHPFFVGIWLKNSIFGEFSNIYLLSAQNRVKWRHKSRPIAKNFRPILILFARDDAKLMPGEVCQVSCRYSNKWRSYSRKTEGGSDPTPPPRRCRVKGWNTVFTQCARWMRIPIQIHASLCISLRSRNFFTHRAVVATSAQCFGIGTRIHFEQLREDCVSALTWSQSYLSFASTTGLLSSLHMQRVSEQWRRYYLEILLFFGHMGQRGPTVVRFAPRFLKSQNVFYFLRC